MNICPIKVIFFDIGDTLVTKVPGNSRLEWIEGARESLLQLKVTSVRLGLISNTGNLTRSQLFDDLLPLNFSADLFEESLIILSSEVGVEKPHFEIFARAIDKAGAAPAECLFCTEDLGHTLAAQAMGMRAVWLPWAASEIISSMTSGLIEIGDAN